MVRIITLYLVENYELMENFLENFFSNIMKDDCKSFPILFSEPPLHNKEFRLKMTEIMMEKFKIPGFFMNKSPVLSSFSCGKSTCLVVDSGHNCTYVSIVQEGYVNQKSIKLNLKSALFNSEFGGNYLTNEILKSLENRNIDLIPLNKKNNNMEIDQEDSSHKLFMKKVN